MNWYVIYAKRGREDMASALLGQAGLEVYVPKLKANRYRGGRYRSVVEPLFPCYVFARFDPDAHLWMVNYTRGVRKVLGDGDGPWPVSEKLICLLRSREADGLITVGDAEIKEGDTVRIADGPFGGLEAVFKRQLEGAERAVLLVKAIEYQAQVVAERASLIKIG